MEKVQPAVCEEEDFTLPEDHAADLKAERVPKLKAKVGMHTKQANRLIHIARRLKSRVKVKAVDKAKMDYQNSRTLHSCHLMP